MPMLLKVFSRTQKVLPFKCCYNNTMRSLEMTSGDSEMTFQFGTWKRLLGNECERVARLRHLLDVAATTESCGGLPARPAI